MPNNEHNQSTQKGLIAWFVNNPVAANLLMLIILFAGISTALGLRIEGFPSTPPTSINIEVNYESGDPHQAEEGIALKIEQALLGISGIKTLTSTSTAKGAQIQIESEHGYDLDKLNTQVKNKVDGIFAFPVDAEKPVISQRQWEQDALWISIYGDTNQQQLQKVAQQFENALLSLPSVNKVTRTGWKNAEIAIEIDELRLQAHGLTLAELANKIRAESQTETSGELRSNNGIILLKADKLRYFYQDFANIVLAKRADGSELTLSQIATIRDAYTETPNILSRFQGKTAINLEVKIDRDANIMSIAEQARQLVNQWQAQRLPENVQIQLWMDQSINMLERLSLVVENGLIGILLVMLVLTIFLNLRIAFWVGMGLPLCFAGGLLLMGDNFFDLTLNQLTTFGFVLVLGILVDDAVVVGESIHTSQQQLGSSKDAVILGAKKVAIPTTFGVLTTVAAFYPLSFVDGRLGSLFAQFAFICTACLLFSLLESKLILPAHLRKTKAEAKTANHIPARVLAWLQKKANNALLKLNRQFYQPLLHKALDLRYACLLLFAAIFVLVVGMLPSGKVGFQFFPDIPEEVVTISYRLEPGLGYGLAHQQLTKIESVVQQLNQQWQQKTNSKTDVIAHMYSLVADDISGRVTLELSPKQQRSVDVVTVVQALQAALQQPQGLQELIVTWDDFDDDKDFVLSYLSDDATELQQAIDMTMQQLQQTLGVKDLSNSLTATQPQLRFELTPQGRALGLSTGDLAEQIQQSFYGVEVQRLQRGKEEVRVRVLYPKQQRQDITSLEYARVRTNSGEVVPLSSVANVTAETLVTEIQRRDGFRSASISANIDDTLVNVDQLYELLNNTAFSHIKQRFPGLQIIKDGDAEQEQQSSRSLIFIFAFSLLLIYVLVAIPLQSYWQPLVIMAAIPFGIVGAILGHWFMGIAFSILSIFGILALSGVVVNDSLLLVNQYNQLRQSGIPERRALVLAGSQRMRAILLTSVTTCLGLLSLLQETSEQAQFLIPAATSLAYGIAFATLISLLLIPVILAIALDLAKFSKTAFNAMTGASDKPQLR